MQSQVMAPNVAARSADVLAVMLDAVPAFALIVRADGGVEFFNRALVQACLAPDQGRPHFARLDAIVPAEAAARLLAPGGVSGLRAPLVGGLRPGAEAEWSSRRLRSDKEIVLVTGRDVSREAQLEGYIVANQWFETAAALSGGLAHDFNNVLAAILGLSEIVSLRLPPGSPLQTFTEKIGHSVDRAKGLVRRFSQFSRKGTGLIEPQPTAMVLSELGTLLVGFLPGSVSFEAGIDPETPWCLADRHALEHILINCANFLRTRLRAEGGKVVLRSRGTFDPRSVLAELSGSGQDLLGLELESLFDLGLEPGSNAYESGAGLYAARLLARHSHGELRVRRDDPRTITFVLELPVAD
jgi:nitrogen-specific signal transduction histidine kinase